MKRISIFFIVIDFFLLTILYIPYLPINKVHKAFINSTINSKLEGCLFMFFDDSIIYRETSENNITTLNNNVSNDMIVETILSDQVENEYEEAILTRDFNNEDYKVINIKIGNVDGFIVAVYDPSKIILMTSSGFNKNGSFYTEKVSSMAKRYGSIVSINGGGYDDITLTNVPRGCVIQNNKIIWNIKAKVDLIGFNSDNRLVLMNTTCNEAINMGIHDAVTFSPFLIRNGIVNKNPMSGGGFTRASRVAIAQRLDGIILFLVTNGNHQNGPLMTDVIDVLVKYGAYNAANLDGGASTTLIINNQLLNKPYNIYGQYVTGGRGVITAFGVKK